MGFPAKAVLAVVLVLLLLATHAGAELLILSSLAGSVEEAEGMRSTVLNRFGSQVSFVGAPVGPWSGRLKAEGRSDSGDARISLAMGTHDQLVELATYLAPVNDIIASDALAAVREGSPALVRLAGMQGSTAVSVPLMQSSFLFAANVKAFDHLPAGLSREKIESGVYTYDDLLAWARKMHTDTGTGKLGFPAGPQGQQHRFLQGYLYPAFTGGVVRTFKSEAARSMWEYCTQLWQYVDRRSANASSMAELLLQADGPLLVFEHTSRLRLALDSDPINLVAFPVPSGPKGKAFMSVLVGGAIPINSPDRSQAQALIRFLSTPETQGAMLRATGQLPLISPQLLPQDLPISLSALTAAVASQTGAGDALPSLPPSGLHEKAALFDKVYGDTFHQIVLRGADLSKTLDRQASSLRRIINSVGTPCWTPDAPSTGPCPVE